MRPSAFEEGLDAIRRLLDGETVSGTRRYRFKEATVSPRTTEPLEVWIGGSVEASIDRAARLGDGWLAGPELDSTRALGWSDFYRLKVGEYGREPTAVAIRRDIFVGESDSHAASIAGPIVEGGYRGLDPSALVFGSPETVAARFCEYAKMGYTDVIVRHLTDDQEAVLSSMARLAEVRKAVADA